MRIDGFTGVHTGTIKGVLLHASRTGDMISLSVILAGTDLNFKYLFLAQT